MSENSREKRQKVDRRVVRTRDRLGDALVEIVKEKPFDEVTVREVADRAGVGRSTFYEHFRDTQDLFLSDADEFLEMMATALSRSNEISDRVAPVRELFEHVAENRKLYRVLIEAGSLHAFLELAQGHFARGIAQRLEERSPSIPIEASVAVALAGSLMSMMTWWLDHGTSVPAYEMDVAFHKLVWKGVAGS